MAETLRHELLGGKKTERILFAVTPELKRAVGELADEECVSLSSFITKVLADEVVRRMEAE